MHLDALLASAKVDECLRNGARSEDALAAQNDLPLERSIEANGQWVWKASQLLFEPSSPPLNVQMTRRMDVDLMAEDRDQVFSSRRRAVRIGTGPFRNYDLRVPVQWQKEVTAYGIGEVTSVHNLLLTIVSLGRLRRNGWGKIASLVVTPLRIGAVDHWKKRTLPLSFRSQALPEHQLAQGTWRAPYWDRAKWGEVLEWTQM